MPVQLLLSFGALYCFMFLEIEFYFWNFCFLMPLQTKQCVHTFAACYFFFKYNCV